MLFSSLSPFGVGFSLLRELPLGSTVMGSVCNHVLVVACIILFMLNYPVALFNGGRDRMISYVTSF